MIQPSFSARHFEARRQALRDQLHARNIPFMVVTKPENLFYLTGFRGSAGIAVLGDDAGVLLVDPRYSVQAREQTSVIEVIEVTRGLHVAAGARLRKLRVSRIGFEETHLTVGEFERFRKEGPALAQWTPGGGLIESLRLVKDDQEVDLIRKACKLTSQAFEELLPQVQSGSSECSLATELDFLMRRKGAEEVAFQTIVASGPRAALPHARPSGKRLKPGELVIFDLGAILGGYAADMTRTVFLGDPGRRVRRLYAAVFDAQREAIGSLRADVKAGVPDAAARRALARRQLDRYFTHSTGHGVGIEIHECPRLGKGEKTRIPAGSIVTIEPGIYIEGFGGIRIEDTVLVTMQGVEILTPASKEQWYTG